MQTAEVDRLLMKPTQRRLLGKYVLLGRLGHGGMGKIYLAYAPGPGSIEKLLVIKRLHSHLTNDPVLVNNFLDEARLSMALSHPNIVHTYDVGEVDGRYFIVMEYIDGQNLGVLLRTAKRSGSYPDSTLWAGLFVHVLDALHAAHTARDARGRELHIIHRDVSPQNVLVSYDGQAKLVDFGIAKAALRVSETDAGVLKGKYSYMSPEQCQSAPLDPRSDVFSAGIVLWEMLAGRRLYKADSIVKSVERILTEPPIPPVRVNADCDPELSKVVVKALQKKPDDRFSSAEEFRHALDEALHHGRRFRHSEVRELMDRLFRDVRERQQRLLEACLAGVAEVVDDDNVRGAPGDSDSHVPLGRSGTPSESDVNMPQLGYEPEPTTPSAHRRSPLVTEEEEDSPKRAVIPAVASVSSGAPTSARLASPPPVTPAPSRKSSSLALVAAGATLGVILLLIGALVFAFATGRLGGEDTARDVEVQAAIAPSSTSPSTPSSTAPAESEPGARPSATDDADKPAALSTERALTEERTKRSADERQERSPPSQAEATRNERAGAESDDERAARKGTKTPARRTSERVEKTERRDEPPPPPPSDKAEKPAAAEPASATLTLETVPWSVVYLGRKKLGETPLVNVPIPAGELELLLVNPDKNIRQPYFLKAEPGQSYRRRLALE